MQAFGSVKEYQAVDKALQGVDQVRHIIDKALQDYNAVLEAEEKAWQVVKKALQDYNEATILKKEFQDYEAPILEKALQDYQKVLQAEEKTLQYYYRAVQAEETAWRVVNKKFQAYMEALQDDKEENSTGFGGFRNEKLWQAEEKVRHAYHKASNDRYKAVRAIENTQEAQDYKKALQAYLAILRDGDIESQAEEKARHAYHKALRDYNNLEEWQAYEEAKQALDKAKQALEGEQALEIEELFL